MSFLFTELYVSEILRIIIYICVLPEYGPVCRNM